MTDAPTLCSVFLASAEERRGVAVARTEDLEQTLVGLVQKGRAAWPEVDLHAQVFVRHLAAHATCSDSIEQALGELHVEDLYLACACVHGIPAALAAFERSLLARVAGFLTRMNPPAVFVDEVKQSLRVRLLVAEPGAAPKIADYSGRGALHSWLRVAALRAAIDLRRQHEGPFALASHGDNGNDTDGHDPVGEVRDPELGYLKQRYAGEFKDAFRTALSVLSSEQRNVLRLNFVDGLNIDQIGALLHIHRSTVARWIASARSAILREAQRLLRERLGVSETEFDSLARLLRSQLDVSLTGLFVEERHSVTP